MVFPAPHNVLQVYGIVSGAGYEDVWSMSLRIGKPDATGEAASGTVNDAVLADIKTDLTTWWNAMAVNFPTTTKLMGFKFNAVNREGRYMSETSTKGGDFGATGLAGTSTSHSLPPQCSIVVTLNTATARGLASKGRVFLPPFTSGVLQAGGVISTAAANATQTPMAQLLTNLNNWPGIDAVADPGDVIVASKVRDGAFRKVTSVSVGSVIDTQRRRRNAFREQRPAVTAVT